MVPLSGLEDWFPLEGREVAKTKKSRGELKLRFSLSAGRPDSQYTFQDNFNLCEQLLAIVVEYEMQSDSVSPSSLKNVKKMKNEKLENVGSMNELLIFPLHQYWCGQLPESALLVLPHLAVHRGLQPWMKNLCLWSVYSSVLQRRNLDFHLVRDVLQKLCGIISTNQIGDEEEQFMSAFWAASGRFVTAALASIHNARNCLELWRSSNQMSALLQ